MRMTKENACIRVETLAAELERLGLDEQDFYTGSTGAEIFISAVIAMLRTKGFSGEPTVVTSCNDGRLVLRLYYMQSAYETALCFAHGSELARFCRENLCCAVTSSKIYKYHGCYWLIVRTSAPIDSGSSDPVICAKIKEYGRYLCDTPVDKLF